MYNVHVCVIITLSGMEQMGSIAEDVETVEDDVRLNITGHSSGFLSKNPTCNICIKTLFNGNSVRGNHCLQECTCNSQIPQSSLYSRMYIVGMDKSNILYTGPC